MDNVSKQYIKSTKAKFNIKIVDDTHFGSLKSCLFLIFAQDTDNKVNAFPNMPIMINTSAKLIHISKVKSVSTILTNTGLLEEFFLLYRTEGRGIVNCHKNSVYS